MKHKFTFLVLLAIMFVTLRASAQTTTYYVSAANGNDGNPGLLSSSPFKTLTKAIAVMRGSNVKIINILVEKGTYYPWDGIDPSADPAKASFLLFRNETDQFGKTLRVLGGYDFATGIRDFARNPTELAGNGFVWATHVVVIGNVNSSADSLVIEGLQIYGGGALGTGFTNYTSTVGVTNQSGGGMILSNCDNTRISIRNCQFITNLAYSGGAVFAGNSQGPVFENCVFFRNTALFDTGIPGSANGGAAYVITSNMKFLNCVFSGNRGNFGSAINLSNTDQTLTVGNCTFVNNDKSTDLILGNAPVIRKFDEQGRVEITNSIFYLNSGGFGGLLLMGTKAQPGNPASGNFFVSNCMSDDNSDPGYASGPFTELTDNPFVASIEDGRGNDSYWMTDDDLLQLKQCPMKSPAIDFGKNNYAAGSLRSDILGRPRISESVIDLGAYESPGLADYWPDNDQDGYGNDRGIEPLHTLCPPAGYVPRRGDCNDGDKDISPAVSEICDGKDNNCNGQIDEGLSLVANITDADGDGYGDPNGQVRLFCRIMPGYSANNQDCDDANKDIYPGAPELCDGKDNDCNGVVDDGVSINYYLDADSDGYGKTSDVISSCIPVAGRVTQSGDCDDNDNTVHPGAPDICDGKDNDCNGYIDEDLSLHTKYYRDVDGDGFGNGLDFLFNCGPLQGRVTKDGDCNDNDNTIYPGAPELCDGRDNNCDGQTDENLTKTTYYIDLDGDGYGNTSSAVQRCVALSQWVTQGGDCDDNDASVTDGRTWYKDADNDGYSDGTTKSQCDKPTGYKLASELTATSGDCDDNNASVHATAVWYKDTDNDGYSDGTTKSQCDKPTGYKLASELTATRGDCDDNNASVHATAVWYKDADNDGYSDGTTKSQCARPTGYKLASELTATSGDCNDSNASVHGVSVWYKDADNDGYSDGTTKSQCARPTGYKLASELTATSGDCNDSNASVHGVSVWYKDADNDGYSDGTTKLQCARPTGYKLASELTATSGDCDDSNASVRGTVVWYKDADNDGYSDGITKTQCTRPTGYKLASELKSTNGDCDDSNASAYGTGVWYKDADNDGYSDGTTKTQCARPTEYKLSSELKAVTRDCNDNDKTIYPNAPEICDGKDNDCDGKTDEDVTKKIYFRDADGDGWGNTWDFVLSCTPVTGRVLLPGDCNDNDNTVYPFATELCDGKDNDCDGQTDEGTTKANYYRDADGDGYGKTSDVVASCTPVSGRVTKNGDCNDNDKNVNPGATEIPGNGKDDNCNGQTDEGCGNLSNLTEASITKTSALLKWTASANPAQWQIRYRQYNASQWIVLNACDGDARTSQLTGLKCNTKYEWSIRAYCNKAWKDYSDKKSFTTSSCSSTATRSATADESNEEVRKVQVETKVWPNPTHGSFMLSVDLGKAETQTASIKIIDLSGRVVYHENTAIPNGRLQKQMNMPVGLGAGVYVVVITTQNNNQQFKIEYLK